MKNTFNFLSTVKKEISGNQQDNPFFVPFLLLFVTITLPLGVSNVALGVFLATVIFYRKKLRFQPMFSMIVLIVLFLWMATSLIWTIDVKRTLSAIPREISLLVLPLSFMAIPAFSEKNKLALLKYYSFSMVIFTIVFFGRAVVRYALSGDSRVFFYHGEYDDDFGLVPKLLNAIHVSIFVSIAFFYFLSKRIKSKTDWLVLLTLLIFIVLLSSKNIIVVVGLLTCVYVFCYANFSRKLKVGFVAIGIISVLGMVSIPKIQDRFMLEFNTMFGKAANENLEIAGVRTTSVHEAWNNEKFSHGDYLSGTALRVYQIRVFFELFSENDVFWTGFGMNASQLKLFEKEKQYNLYPGYGKFNFHNQYVQNFAELGIIGFLLLLIPLIINIKNAIKTKDFVHLAFAIIMVSAFVTESFLWRQRGVTFFVIFYCLFNASDYFRPKNEL